MEVGSLVKISNGAERFYVEVMDINKYEFLGRVKNMIVSKRHYKFGDFVIFDRSHIIEILSPSEALMQLKNAENDPELQNKIKIYVQNFEKEHNRTPRNIELFEYSEKYLNLRIMQNI